MFNMKGIRVSEVKKCFQVVKFNLNGLLWLPLLSGDLLRYHGRYALFLTLQFSVLITYI